MQPLSDSGLATTSGKSPEDWGWGAWGGEPGRWCDLSQARSQPGARHPRPPFCLACWWDEGCQSERETEAEADTMVTSAWGGGRAGVWERLAQPGVRDGSLEQTVPVLGLENQ